MPKRKTQEPAPLPPSHLDRCEAMGLRIVTYLNRAIQTEYRSEWLPRDIVALDGQSLIVYRESDHEYDFSGWCPEHRGMFGGRYDTIHSALSWLQRAIDIKAGRISDFNGV